MYKKTVVLLSLLLCSLSTYSDERSDAKAAYERDDYLTAFILYESLAVKGDVTAKNNVAYMYYNGIGVPQDYAQAFTLYEELAAQGHVIAQNALGAMYAQGQGVSQDYEQAFNWYKKAAEQGDVEAQFNIGFMYKKERGVLRIMSKHISGTKNQQSKEMPMHR